MIPAAFGLAWTALALAAAILARPVRSRLPTVGSAGVRSRPDHPCGPLEVLGRAVLRLSGSLEAGRRRPAVSTAPPAPLVARTVGAVAVGCAAAAVLSPFLVPVVLVGGWIWPRIRAGGQERRRLLRLEEGLPEVVDLLLLAVGSGANVTMAVAAAGRRGSGPLAAELARVAADVNRGRRVGDALDELPTRAGEATRPLAAALAASDRYGSPLGPALERLGDDVRRQRQRRAEEAARKVPVLLLFPLILCILPAFALLTVAPLVAGALRALRL